jgi:hypothetical protein
LSPPFDKMEYFVAFLGLFVSFVLGETCSTVDQAYPSLTVAYSSSSAYSQSQADYWNKQSQYMTPTCILFPENTKDVMRIIDILGTNNEKFAIKGGGHMPNVNLNKYEIPDSIKLDIIIYFSVIMTNKS